MRFNVLSQGGKLFGANGSFYVINLDKSLPSMSMGGMGDPHMVLRIKNGAVLARWDDNATGSENTELLFFHLETDTDTISVFYTNTGWGGAKTIGSARYIHNGVSSNLTGTVVVGPVEITRQTWSLDISFDKIDNVKKFGGGFAIALAASQAVGGYADGGWGPQQDGYGALADMILKSGVVNAPSRNDMVVGQGVTITDGVVSASSSVIFDTSNDNIQKILGFANANGIGARAENAGLPLNPVVLQQANINQPGGDFDGLINPPGNTNGIIDAQGNTGPGLHVFGNDGMPENLAGLGTYNADNNPSPSQTPTPSSTVSASTTPTATPTRTPTPTPSIAIQQCYYCTRINTDYSSCTGANGFYVPGGDCYVAGVPGTDCSEQYPGPDVLGGPPFQGYTCNGECSPEPCQGSQGAGSPIVVSW